MRVWIVIRIDEGEKPVPMVFRSALAALAYAEREAEVLGLPKEVETESYVEWSSDYKASAIIAESRHVHEEER